jgi:hypothetical protein
VSPENVIWLVNAFVVALVVALGWVVRLKAANAWLSDDNAKLRKTNERLALKVREYRDRDEDREQELFTHAQWLKRQQRETAEKSEQLLAKLDAPKTEGQSCES